MNKEDNFEDNPREKTINVEFSVFANLRDYTRFKKKTYQTKAGITIGEFLMEIAKSFPNGTDFLHEVMELPDEKENNGAPPKLRKYYKIILNGRILFTEEALSTPIIQDNSIIAMFPPIGGG